MLEIDVWREPDVSVPGAVVRSDGNISLPLIKDLQVRGLTPIELEHFLTKAFAEFINAPNVTVIVKEIHSEKVYVIGGVKNPGSIPLQSPMTVLQVLAEAGGLTDFAKKNKIYVLRPGGDWQSRLPFEYDAVLKGKHPEQNVLARPGDTIVVPE